ncbi:unnamed protein product, partial [marine sediment metagenome]
RHMPAGHAALGNVLFAPLMLEGVPCGLMGLANKPGGFTKRDARVAMGFGELAAVALKNSRMLEALASSEKSLRESQELFKSFMNTGPVVAFMKDEEGRYVYVNTPGERFLGIGRGEWGGKTDCDLFPEEVAKQMREHDLVVLSSDEGAEFPETVRVSGGVQHMLTFKFPFRDAGGRRFLAGMSIDVSDRVRAEEALRDSEEKFRSLVETTSDWMWEVDTNGVYTYTSPRVKDLLGYEPVEILGKTPFDLMPPEEGRRVGKIFAEITASHKPFDGLENTNVHKDAHLVVLETSGRPIFGPDGLFMGYRGIDRDITERKHAEAEIARLAKFPSENPNPVLRVSRDGAVVYANTAGASLLEKWGT